MFLKVYAFLVIILEFIYHVMSISAIQQSDPLRIYIHSFSHVILHHVPSQTTGLVPCAIQQDLIAYLFQMQ